MRRPLFFLWAVLWLSSSAGCGKKAETQESRAAPGATASQIPPADVRETKGEALAESQSLNPIEGVYLRPYFDQAGATELAVAPGDEFDVNLYTDTVEPYSTSAVQFRLDMPPGVKVESVTETDERSISMGRYDKGYSIAYNCQPAGKFLIITFHCVAEPGFRGGEVGLSPGLGGDYPYLGFVTCDNNMAPAFGGKATLKQK